jgi:hypothetical protein
MVLTMSVGLLALSTPLAAQARGAWTTGFSATLGNGWQYEGVDFGVVRPATFGPMRNYLLMARIGSFIDEAAIIGGTRGFVGGIVLGFKTGAVTIAEVGHEIDLSRFALDLTLEIGGYGAANSPLPEGSSWFSAAALPGFRFGRETGMQVVLSAGPVLFAGREAKVRGFLDIRVEFPLGPS